MLRTNSIVFQSMADQDQYNVDQAAGAGGGGWWDSSRGTLGFNAAAVPSSSSSASFSPSSAAQPAAGTYGYWLTQPFDVSVIPPTGVDDSSSNSRKSVVVFRSDGDHPHRPPPASSAPGLLHHEFMGLPQLFSSTCSQTMAMDWNRLNPSCLYSPSVMYSIPCANTLQGREPITTGSNHHHHQPQQIQQINDFAYDHDNLEKRPSSTYGLIGAAASENIEVLPSWSRVHQFLRSAASTYSSSSSSSISSPKQVSVAQLTPAAAAPARPLSSNAQHQLHHDFTNDGPFWNPSASAAVGMSSSSFFPTVLQQHRHQLISRPGPSDPDEKTKPNAMMETRLTRKKNSVSCGSSDRASSSKRPMNEGASSTLPPFKVRKEKMGDRISVLQQLVSPFGKTDTASVLSEAIEYIKFLHEQVNVLSTPYLKSRASLQQPHSNDKSKDQEASKQDLRSRGLCLVPISSTFPVTHETPSDFWTPTFGATFR